ncbi:MAG: hypothetical protein FWB84_02880 [Candidatus Bathyarchaeota archaeon]|jgi:hypothetical protein|uniref:hypothetical protein n=1 Tax=Candidatus Bathycorpusculum sp. TaxID=2994959 RepID=UPI00282841BA|nr:hypothetical protein [Candidatus Termiticorpusculum sp.]MCL2257646.1 hypothetical protein [Candidatus Termiticorpusculum sp.]MCL2292218.1 hypothetical protein [Candidatus Termiticorpusculum sp.]
MVQQRKDKKLVYVNYALLEKVAQVSKSRGETITKFLEDALIQAIKVTTSGYDLKQFGQFFEVLYAQRILGGAFVPLDVLNFLTDTAIKDGKDGLANVWFESGKWHGKYLKERFKDPVKSLETFLEASRWDLSEVEVKQVGAITRIRCISTVLSEDATNLLAKFIEGIMHGFDYKLQKSDLLKGLIVMEFVS